MLLPLLLSLSFPSGEVARRSSRFRKSQGTNWRAKAHKSPLFLRRSQERKEAGPRELVLEPRRLHSDKRECKPGGDSSRRV